jgi:putative tryptophan/tyrosine transport system substrate-binding protein
MGQKPSTSYRTTHAEIALRHRLPGMFGNKAAVEAGGLMSYGADGIDLMRRAAGYVDKILRGAKPADLPVEQASKFELVINSRLPRRSASTCLCISSSAPTN